MLKRIIQILSIIILIALIGLLIFVTYIYYDTKPVLEANIAVKGISNNTEIIRDEAGIPHIFARNDIDAYFSLGYAVAQDRLWQMVIMRLIANGKSSEYLGDKYIPLDILIKTLGISERAIDISEKILVKNSEEHYIKCMKSYINGINTYLNQINNDLPIEFRILHFKPEPFRIQDVYAVNGLIRYAMTYDKLTLLKMINDFGKDRMEEILPILSNFDDKEEQYDLLKECKIDFDWKTKGDRLLKTIIPPMIGNSIAISGGKSENGYPLLSSNLLTTNNLPQIFYEAHIATPQQNFYGYFLPLSPFGFIGHNEYISWGITNLMVDDTDYYIETLHPNNPTSYKYNGEWKQMDISRERINIKGKKKNEDFIRYETENGVVLSNMDCHKALTFHWSYYDDNFIEREEGLRDDWFKTYYILNHSENYKQFREGLSYYWGNGISIAYSDSFGNIASLYAGQIPKRGEKNIPYRFQDNSHQLHNWSGYYDFYELPANLNPDKNYIIHANSKPSVFNHNEYYTSFFHYQDYRYSRIEQLINNKDKLNPDYIKNIHDDVLDLIAEDILPNILETLRDKDDYSFTETEYALIEIIENWDYKTSPDSTGALVFNELYYHIMSNTLKDELSESGFKRYLDNDILYTNFVNLIKKAESSWFDDKDTIGVENLELVLKKSLANSYKSLKSRFGNKLKNWTWGKTHRTKYKHLLGDIFPYNMIFNSKDINLSGSFVSISKTIYDVDSLYKPISHSGVKFISNMQSIRSSETLSATGNSGHFHNENYLDQFDKWYRKDNYRDPVNSKEEAYKVMNNRIKLIPKD